MALIEFKDLPDTSTPLNASNLNNNFNECYQADSGWIDMQLKNSWATYTQNYQKAQYRKIGNQVFIRGLINGGSANTDFVQLPTGYRPSLITYLPVVDDAGANVIKVSADGNLRAYSYTAYIALSGSFFVD